MKLEDAIFSSIYDEWRLRESEENCPECNEQLSYCECKDVEISKDSYEVFKKQFMGGEK